MSGVAHAEQTVGSGLVVAFIAVVPLIMAALNLLWGYAPDGTRKRVLDVETTADTIRLFEDGKLIATLAELIDSMRCSKST